jgi:hypothetical protein
MKGITAKKKITLLQQKIFSIILILPVLSDNVNDRYSLSVG